jgi:hypothetical protein
MPIRLTRRGAAVTLASVLLAVSSVAAQDAQPAVVDPHTAQPERPTVATHAYTVAPGYWELEGGWQYQAPPGTSINTVPLLVKIGVARGVQLDVASSVVQTRSAAVGTQRAPGDLTLAAKVRVATLPVLGDFSVQPSLKLPTGSVAQLSGTGTTDGGLLLISSHQFGPLEIDANAGWTVRSGDGSHAPRNAWLWTVSGGAPVARGVGATAEVFGYPGTIGPASNPPQVGFLFGPTLTARKWLVFDTGVIASVENLGPTAFYAGVTANLGRLF